MSKSQPLRPGELKILTALLEKDKTNGELREETGLFPSILSKYLKRLQKLGLVTRDIDTRRYVIDRVDTSKAGRKQTQKERVPTEYGQYPYIGRVPITVQVLFFNEMLEFVRVWFDGLLKKRKKGGLYNKDLTNEEFKDIDERINDAAGLIQGPNGWLTMTEKPGQSNFIKKRLQNLKNYDALFTVSRIIEDSWEEYCFSTMDKNDQHVMKRLKTIETYKQYLLEIAEQLYPFELPEQNEKLFAELFESVKKEMLAAYPGFDVPEEMIRLETNRRLKKFAERHARIMMTPSNLNHLYTTLEVFEKLEKQEGSQKGLTEEEMQKLEKKIAYLKDPKNKKVYEEHLNRLNNIPKSLIFYPSWGFKGYPEKLIDLVPKHQKRT